MVFNGVNSDKSIRALSGKRILRCLSVVLVVVAALWFGFNVAGKILCPIAIAQIAELTNTQINVGSVDLNLDGSVFIEDLSIKLYQKQTEDDEILSAQGVYARFGIISLLLLRPQLKEISVNDFAFNARYDSDAHRWNLADLKLNLPKKGPGKMPLILLERGILRYSEQSQGLAKVIAAVPVNLTLRPAEKTEDGCIFYITMAKKAGFDRSVLMGFYRPGRVKITGALSSVHFPLFEMPWSISVFDAELDYDRSRDYSLKLKIKDLLSKNVSTGGAFGSGGPSFLERFGLYNALQKFLNRYRPVGEIDLDVEVSGNLSRPSESALLGKVHCKDISICDRKFPYRIEQLAGEIGLTERSATLNNLCGSHGNVKLFFNGWSRDFGPDWKYQIWITSDNMVLDDALYDALSTKQKRFWSAFSPSGVAAIDYRVSRKSATDKKKILTVELFGVDAAYHHFPYPLGNLTGRLLFDPDNITISNLRSQLNGREITLNGRVTACSTDRPICDISVKAEDVLLDSILGSALSDRQRYFYEQLDMTGSADADIEIFTPKEDSAPTTFIADVSLKKTSLKVPELQKESETEMLEVNKLPLLVSDISASVVFTPGLIRIENFAGRYGQGPVSLTGRIWTGDESQQPRYCLSINTEQIEINDDLIFVLPASLEKVVSELHLGGQINLTADLNRAGTDDCPDYKMTVDCLGNNIDFEEFRYPIKDITGSLTITKKGVEMKDITATVVDDVRMEPKASGVKINGQVSLVDDDFDNGRLQPSSADITLTAETFRVKGKAFRSLKADVYYDPSRQSWVAENFLADSYGGKVTGNLQLKQSANRPLEYLLQIGFNDIDLERFLSDTKHKQTNQNGYTSGKMDGSLSIAGPLAENLPRIGQCRFQIVDMQVGKLSPLAKLLNVLQLNESKDFAFDRMLVDSYINHDKLFFEQFDLSGESVAFNGTGWLNLKTEDVDLTLTARGRRLATAEPSVFQSLTEDIGRAVVRMDVTGNVYDPQVKTSTFPAIKEAMEILGTEPDESK